MESEYAFTPDNAVRYTQPGSNQEALDALLNKVLVLQAYIPAVVAGTDVEHPLVFPDFPAYAGYDADVAAGVFYRLVKAAWIAGAAATPDNTNYAILGLNKMTVPGGAGKTSLVTKSITVTNYGASIAVFTPVDLTPQSTGVDVPSDLAATQGLSLAVTHAGTGGALPQGRVQLWLEIVGNPSPDSNL